MRSLILRLAVAVALAISTLVSPAWPAHATPVLPMHLAAIPLIEHLFSGQRPGNLGVKDGKLSPCPASPNCVVSQGEADAEHAIAPIQYSGDATRAMQHLETVIKTMPRTSIVEQTDTYLYAEFASQWMGYVDDVEFYIDPTESVIHVRSASRLGQSDLGVNRRRIETIRSAFSA
jgi:uncharacterized protein (DUF1499 family)